MKVFIPGHITSLFFPVMVEDPLKSGSQGTGVSISHGYEVEIETFDGDGIEIYQNGDKVPNDDAKITFEVAKHYSQIMKKKIVVKQEFEIPTGAGYGSSAAGSLGTSICLGRLSGKTLHKSARIAHQKEVINGGGLGDVYPQIVGGVEIRRKEGPPGYGWVDNMIVDNDWKIISASYGDLNTSKVLNDDKKTKKIRKFSKKKIEKIKNSPNIYELMKNSRDFVERLGLMEDPINDVLYELDDIMKVPPSMVMLGKTIFGFSLKKDVKRIINVIEEYNPDYGPIVSNIDFQGARVI